jgi:CheY-like chemotaxis protein
MNAKIEKVTFDTIRRSTPPYSISRPPIAYSILLIEDEGSMGQVTQLLLESCGYEVTVAADGAQGLRLVKALSPNLIICDVNMPGMSGVDVVQALRQSDTTRHIPVVFLSGFISDEQKKEAEKLGVRAFLGKPCSFEEMKQVITECRHAGSGKTQSAGAPPPLMMSLSA